MDENYGHLEIRLNELLKERGLSKNKLSHKAEMNWKQIDRSEERRVGKECRL